MKKAVIVGYDPGTTSAIAILDTNKAVLKIESKRDFTKKEIIETIAKYGKPIIIAGDRVPTPKNVEKLASSLGCKIHKLTESIPNIEKYKLVNPYAEVVSNNHEKDALASAVKAYDSYKKFFKKIDRVLSYLGFNEYYSRVLEMIIKEEAENITHALNKILFELKEKQEKKAKKKLEKKVEDKDLDELRKTIRTQKNDLEILKKYNDNLKMKIAKLEKKLDNEKKKRVIKGMEDLNDEIKKLRNNLEGKRKLIRNMKEYRKMECDGKIPVFTMRKISLFKTQDLSKDVGLYNRIVMTENSTNALILNDYNIMALVINGKIPKSLMGKTNFPVLNFSDVELKVENGIKYLDRKKLDKLIKEAKKEGFKECVKNYKKRK